MVERNSNTRQLEAEVFPPTGERVTANRTLVSRAPSAGHTVGQFIAALRTLGVDDDMELASIEYGIAQFGSGRLRIDVSPQGLEVREA